MLQKKEHVMEEIFATLTKTNENTEISRKGNKKKLSTKIDTITD